MPSALSLLASLTVVAAVNYPTGPSELWIQLFTDNACTVKKGEVLKLPDQNNDIPGGSCFNIISAALWGKTECTTNEYGLSLKGFSADTCMAGAAPGGNEIMDAIVTLTNCNEFPDADDGSKQYIQPTRMISGCPVIGGDDGDGSGSDDPCFGRDSTFACRLSEDVPATAAFDQCFGEAPETTARRVSMSSLRAGDRVLTELDAVPTTTRVLLNEHVVDTSKSAVVTVKHAAGALTLTPDHVLQVDGEWKSAREARAGSLLSGSHTVTSIVSGREGIINPITISGTILAAGKTGAPVLATTYGDWIAEYMLSSAVYPALSIASGLSYLFPEHVQNYFTNVLEPGFLRRASNAKHLKAIKATVPTPVAAVVIFGFDIILAAGFAAYCMLVNVKVAVAIGAGAAVWARQSTKA